MKDILNNPILHGIATFVAVGIGWFITSGNPILSLTIGAVLKAVYSYLVQA